MPRTNASSITQVIVGEEIRRVRKEQGLTQSELAERLQTAPAYISQVEAGKENLTLGSLARIANALRRGLDIGFPLVADTTSTLDEDLAALRTHRERAAT